MIQVPADDVVILPQRKIRDMHRARFGDNHIDVTVAPRPSVPSGTISVGSMEIVIPGCNSAKQSSRRATSGPRQSCLIAGQLSGQSPQTDISADQIAGPDRSARAMSQHSTAGRIISNARRCTVRFCARYQRGIIDMRAKGRVPRQLIWAATPSMPARCQRAPPPPEAQPPAGAGMPR